MNDFCYTSVCFGMAACNNIHAAMKISKLKPHCFEWALLRDILVLMANFSKSSVYTCNWQVATAVLRPDAALFTEDISWTLGDANYYNSYKLLSRLQFCQLDHYTNAQFRKSHCYNILLINI